MAIPTPIETKRLLKKFAVFVNNCEISPTAAKQRIIKTGIEIDFLVITYVLLHHSHYTHLLCVYHSVKIYIRLLQKIFKECILRFF